MTSGSENDDLSEILLEEISNWRSHEVGVAYKVFASGASSSVFTGALEEYSWSESSSKRSSKFAFVSLTSAVVGASSIAVSWVSGSLLMVACDTVCEAEASSIGVESGVIECGMLESYFFFEAVGWSTKLYLEGSSDASWTSASGSRKVVAMTNRQNRTSYHRYLGILMVLKALVRCRTV